MQQTESETVTKVAREEKTQSDGDVEDQFLQMFTNSNSYWDSYMRTSQWFSQHRSFLQEAQRTGSRYEQWCRSQMAYHTHMANFFYSQWLKSQSVFADRKIKPAFDGSKQKIYMPSSSQNGTPRQESRKQGRSKKSKRSRSRRNKRKLSGHSSCHIELHLSNHDSDNGQLDIVFDGSENTEFEMEITEDMLEFFSESARHRKERDSKKMKSNGVPGRDVYIELSEVSAGKNKATSEPPKERPGFRRIEEMKELYGSGSAMVHGMETAMQLTFDRNSDRKQPCFWPALPINFNLESTKRTGIFKILKAGLSNENCLE